MTLLSNVDALLAVLSRDPNNVEAINDLATLRKSQGFIEAAIAGFELAISLRPDLFALHYNLGNALVAARRFPAAISAYQRAIQLHPRFPEAYQNLGDAQKQLGNLDQAAASYQQSLSLRPDSVPVLNALGLLYHQQGQFAEAVKCFQEALKLNPTSPEILNNLGNTLKELGSTEAAEQAYRSAIVSKPDHVEAHVNLGQLLSESLRHSEAVDSFETALRFRPKCVTALAGLIHQRQVLAQWDGHEELCHRLMVEVEQLTTLSCISADCVPSPLTFIGLAIPTTPALQLANAKAWAISRYETIASRSPRKLRTQSIHRSKLRVGYLSADFQEHPVGFLTVGLFEKHDRTRFELFGYSFMGPCLSPLQERIRLAFDTFRFLDKHSHQEAARLIANDDLDVLIDLQGYSNRSRPEILAQRPAPIQINYLGYPGTMGASFIDYLLVDSYVVPASQADNYSERLIHLPNGFMVYDDQTDVGYPSGSRRDHGLPEHAFVFCAFSMAYKVTQPMFDCWLKILRQTPNSVLWLRDWNKDASSSLRKYAETQSVSGDRLIFAPKLDRLPHLARHRLADLYLDTFPYNQHSTAADALYFGLPMLTLSGQSFASRVAGSLLHHQGLDWLIATDLKEYECKACQLAETPHQLDTFRNQLIARRGAWNTESFTRQLELAYQKITAKSL